MKSDFKDYFFYKNKKSVWDGDRFATHNRDLSYNGFFSF